MIDLRDPHLAAQVSPIEMQRVLFQRALLDFPNTRRAHAPVQQNFVGPETRGMPHEHGCQQPAQQQRKDDAGARPREPSGK